MVVRERASKVIAALNFLAEDSGFSPGVEEREDSDEVESVRLGLNNEVGRKRRFGAWV
jgi:hypothetical protein